MPSVNFDRRLIPNTIVESGNNANGDWIKYADGTMVCYFTKKLNINVSTAWGNLYEGSGTLGNWPQEFVDTPNVFINNISARGALMESFNPTPTKTSAGTIWIARPDTSSGVSLSFTFCVIGIGKWK